MATPLPASPSSGLWPAHHPQNLYAVPASSLAAEFEAECERLFIADDDDDVDNANGDDGDDGVNISIIEFSNVASSGAGTVSPQQRQGVHQHELRSTQQVLAYTNKRELREFADPAAARNPLTPTTTILLLHQTFSWGPLETSPTALRTLLTHFAISAGFWSVLRLFGSKDSDTHESGGGFNELVRNDAVGDDAASFDISYTAKHAEEHHRPERAAYDPWSIRQIGVAQRYDARTGATVFVIVNPSRALVERLKGVGPGMDMLEVHRLVLCAVTERWGQYLAYLERVCKDISKKAVLAQGTTNRGFEVHFSDSQRIRDLQDTIIHVSHMLDQNLSIADNLLAPEDLFVTSDLREHSGRSSKSSILTLAAQTRLWKCHAESLPRRLDGSSVLVSSILNAKALETLQRSSGTTAELAALARADAVKAKQDARTLTTITILGFVYLPASFVATLLGTQYINIRDNPGSKVSITFAREMWIFAVLTLSLFVMTVGIWQLWEWRNRLGDRAADENSGKTV